MATRTDIEAAIAELRAADKPNIAQVARKYQIERTRLSRLFKGTRGTLEESIASKRLLSPQQDFKLLEFVNRLTRDGLPPTPAMLRQFAKELCGRLPSDQWPHRWLQRHKEDLDSRFLKGFDLDRKKADSHWQYQAYFTLLAAKLEQYQVQPSDTYNMDEKGFMIGVLQESRRYFSAKEAKSKRLKGAGQDGNREWVTIIASICQDGEPLPPAIIYAAATNNHQDSWYEELSTEEAIAHFITSPNGWTNDDIGYEWLSQVFDRHTRQKARNGRDYRLLYLDGHSSHLNMRFIEFCDANKILLMAYPPHSTHRLQPLDVSLFNPLANFYSQNLNQWLFNSFGITAMSKRHFWGLFKPAFDAAFRKENIASGWKKTGLYPLDPEVILSQVRIESRPSSSDASTASIISPMGWKRIERHFTTTYGPARSRDERKMKKTLDSLSATTRMQQIEIERLKARLEIEERSSKRQKTLFNELRSETNTNAIFFSPAKIQRAREILLDRERQKQANKDEKEAEKLQRQERKLQQELDKQEKQQKRAQDRDAKLKAIQEAKALRDAKKQAKEDAKKEAEIQHQIDQELIKQSKQFYQLQNSTPASKKRKRRYPVPINTVDSPIISDPGPSRSRPIRRLPQRYYN